MNNINIISYVLADYKINEVFVDICFIWCDLKLLHKKNLIALEEGRLESEIFDGVFNIIKGRVKALIHMKFGMILSNIRIENSFGNPDMTNKEIMYVEVLLVNSEKETQSTFH